jgi:hypothetical protein
MKLVCMSVNHFQPSLIFAVKVRESNVQRYTPAVTALYWSGSEVMDSGFDVYQVILVCLLTIKG